MTPDELRTVYETLGMSALVILATVFAIVATVALFKVLAHGWCWLRDALAPSGDRRVSERALRIVEQREAHEERRRQLDATQVETTSPNLTLLRRSGHR